MSSLRTERSPYCRYCDYVPMSHPRAQGKPFAIRLCIWAAENHPRAQGNIYITTDALWPAGNHPLRTGGIVTSPTVYNTVTGPFPRTGKLTGHNTGAPPLNGPSPPPRTGKIRIAPEYTSDLPRTIPAHGETLSAAWCAMCQIPNRPRAQGEFSGSVPLQSVKEPFPRAGDPFFYLWFDLLESVSSPRTGGTNTRLSRAAFV